MINDDTQRTAHQASRTPTPRFIATAVARKAAAPEGQPRAPRVGARMKSPVPPGKCRPHAEARRERMADLARQMRERSRGKVQGRKQEGKP